MFPCARLGWVCSCMYWSHLATSNAIYKSGSMKRSLQSLKKLKSPGTTTSPMTHVQISENSETKKKKLPFVIAETPISFSRFAWLTLCKIFNSSVKFALGCYTLHQWWPVNWSPNPVSFIEFHHHFQDCFSFVHKPVCLSSKTLQAIAYFEKS